MISESFPKYSVHFYCDVEDRVKLENKIKQINMQDKIIIHGYSNDIYQEVISASLFVSSSDYEGISNSMLEAMALGIPSICTDCPAGGACDIIIPGANGMVVPVGDRNSLSMMMRKVLGNKELARTISAGAYDLRHSLCISEIAKLWIDAIDKFSTNRDNKGM